MRLDEFYDPSKDKQSQYNKDDTRKSRLTLNILNRLRKLRDIQAAEREVYNEFAKKMYGAPPGDEGDSLI